MSKDPFIVAIEIKGGREVGGLVVGRQQERIRRNERGKYSTHEMGWR